MIDYSKFPNPCYIMEEDLLRRNLTLIKDVAYRADVEIILAFKAFALWKSFPIFREFIRHTTASSLYEARLAYEEFGSRAHTYSPAYTEEDFGEIMRCSSHITFNSLSQYERFYPLTKKADHPISCGVRINPEYSEIETDLYNPAAPGCRLGIPVEQMPEQLPDGIEGLHMHALCENDSYALEHCLESFEAKFGHLIKQCKWVNLGGGHLITREGYDIAHLIDILKAFKQRYPNLEEVILEPGEAVGWQTGVLVSTVEDIVENKGIRTAILNVSFSCHMPDCLEMPYKPTIIGAHEPTEGDKFVYRMGGNSCLAGDFMGMGDFAFPEPLEIGDRVVFDDMIHYTMVKTTFFNGVKHPAIGMVDKEQNFFLFREPGYEAYKEKLG